VDDDYYDIDYHNYIIDTQQEIHVIITTATATTANNNNNYDNNHDCNDLFGVVVASTESDTEFEYRIRKKVPMMSQSPSDNSVHDLYRKVQKGGQIPLEGLKYPTVAPETKRGKLGIVAHN